MTDAEVDLTEMTVCLDTKGRFLDVEGRELDDGEAAVYLYRLARWFQGFGDTIPRPE